MASSTLRITGMASGLDVDTMVKSMMKAENTKLDKIKQDRQKVQWRQDLFRETLTDMNTFRSNYFDILKPETNMISSNTYVAFDVTSSDSTIATATAGVGATAGNYGLTVTRIAEVAKISGSKSLNSQVVVTDVSSADWASKTIKFDVGGTSTTIQLDGGINTVDSLLLNINSKISGNTSLNGKISASIVESGGTKYIKFTPLTSTAVKITDAGTPAIADLSSLLYENFKSVDTSSKLTDLGIYTTNLKLNLTYNGTTSNITLDNTSGEKTISDLVSAISTATSGGVTGQLDDVTGKFILKTTNTGSGSIIKINSGVDTTAELTTNLGLTVDSTVQGIDSKVAIVFPDGTTSTLTQSKNTFTLNNVSYNLVKAGASNITVSANAQKILDKVKDFITKYNELIDKVKTKVTEKKQYSYEPLTDEQKKDMEDADIKAWDAKAKEGLLKNDSNLQNMLSLMRLAFFDSIEGAGLTLRDLGLSTSSDFSQGGKIVFDINIGGESKFKETLQSKGQQVADLFMKSSSISYSPTMSSTDRTTRYNNEGIFQRINDILQDYTRTTRDDNGKKGLLVEKAGIKGDFTEFNNLLSEQLIKKDKMISDLTTKLITKENNYYLKYSKLEQAMNTSNAQSSWLASQLGGQ